MAWMDPANKTRSSNMPDDPVGAMVTFKGDPGIVHRIYEVVTYTVQHGEMLLSLKREGTPLITNVPESLLELETPPFDPEVGVVYSFASSSLQWVYCADRKFRALALRTGTNAKTKTELIAAYGQPKGAFR